MSDGERSSEAGVRVRSRVSRRGRREYVVVNLSERTLRYVQNIPTYLRTYNK